MRLPTGILSAAVFVFLTMSAKAGDKELRPAPVNIKGKLTVRDFLIALKKQTGISVIDARAKSGDAPFPFDIVNGTFWTALDTLAQKAGARVSPFHTAGAISLLDGAPKHLAVAHNGLFRIHAQRVSLARDLEEGVHQCQLNLLAVWEPHFRPYYLEVGKWSIVYASAKERHALEAPPQGKQELAGAGATVLSVGFSAPPKRDLDRIASLKGELSVIGPTRMLPFSFDKLAPLGKGDMPREAMKEGVRVTLKEVEVGRSRWSFTLQIENAPGVPEFESYQSWLGNNSITLQKNKDTLWRPNGEEETVHQESAQRALVTYRFTDPRYLTTKLADWTLVYTTPHRIVAVPVEFEIKDIPLP